jgi:DNA-directed RNA polymerase subunit E'/Rpb7
MSSALARTRKSHYGIYMENILTRKLVVPFNTIGKNIEDLLKKVLSRNLEGRCASEGYIKKGSVNIISYSAGVANSENICFDVSFKCEICKPVEGMRIRCTVCNITKAGIRAIYHKEHCKDKDGDTIKSFESPITVFIAREHHIKDKSYSEITKEGEDIIIKVIGTRYQLNDDNISILGELCKIKRDKNGMKQLSITGSCQVPSDKK